MSGPAVPERHPHRIRAVGDSCVMLTASGPDPEQNWRTVHSVTNLLRARRYPFLVSAFATYDSTLVEFDPLRADTAVVTALLWEVLAGYRSEHEDWVLRPRTFEIPVLCDERWGVDLADVAAEQRMDVDEVIAELTGTPFTVRLIAHGGGAMMANPTRVRGVRRLDSPRVADQYAGRVALAGEQCSVTATDAGRGTSGWRVIGRTPVRLLDQDDPQSTGDFRPGDRFRFTAITADRWTDLERAPLREVVSA